MDRDPLQNLGKLPKTFQRLVEKYPDIEGAHQQMAAAVEAIGALDERTAALVKIGICAGAGLETATKSHVHRALEKGVEPKAIEQAIFLSINTIGFPNAMAAWQWARDAMEKR